MSSITHRRTLAHRFIQALGHFYNQIKHAHPRLHRGEYVLVDAERKFINLTEAHKKIGGIFYPDRFATKREALKAIREIRRDIRGEITIYTDRELVSIIGKRAYTTIRKHYGYEEKQ